MLAAVAAVSVVVAVAAVAFALGTRTGTSEAAADPVARHAARSPDAAQPAAAGGDDEGETPASAEALVASSCPELADVVRDDLAALARSFDDPGSDAYGTAYARLGTADWSLCEDVAYPTPVDDAILAAQLAAGLQDESFRMFDAELFGLINGYMPEGVGEPIYLADVTFTDGSYRTECVSPYGSGRRVRVWVEATNTGTARSGFAVRVDLGTGENSFLATGWIDIPPIDADETARASGWIELGDDYMFREGAWCEISDISAY